MAKLTIDQKKTLSSLTKHSDDIYSITYFNDYDLDYVISKEATSVVKVLKAINQVIKKKRSYRIKKLPLGCSTFYCLNENNEHILGRNFDYHTSPSLVIKTSPKNGYKSISICDLNFMLYGYKHPVSKESKRLLYAPYVSIDGMNEKGLAISVLELNDKPAKQKTSKRKISTTVMIRYVLDKCDSVESAIRAFNNFDMHALIGFNYHFHLVDKKESVVIEYVNNQLRIIKPEEIYQGVTNFYLSKDGNNKKTVGFDRYEKIMTRLKEHDGKLNQEEAFTLLKDVSQYYKFTYKFFLRYYVDTCYSAIYNLDKLEMTITKNNNHFTFSMFQK